MMPIARNDDNKFQPFSGRVSFGESHLPATRPPDSLEDRPFGRYFFYLVAWVGMGIPLGEQTGATLVIF